LHTDIIDNTIIVIIVVIVGQNVIHADQFLCTQDRASSITFLIHVR
jgi:hypothetical protein